MQWIITPTFHFHLSSKQLTFPVEYDVINEINHDVDNYQNKKQSKLKLKTEIKFLLDEMDMTCTIQK